MKEAKDVTALVVDHGLFIPLAHRLARGFKRVLYYSPWEEGFATFNRCIVGDGFEDIERCDDVWKAKDDVDLFVFPDIQHAGLQLELERQGKAVWGSREGDSLEIVREKFHKILGKLGLEVPPHERVIGLNALRRWLEEREDQFVKISRYRGTMETKHWHDKDTSGWLFDYLALKFGPFANEVPFLVCDQIETDLEIGGDTYCVDGQFPKHMMQGWEAKDRGYLGALQKTSDMPESIAEVMDAFAPVLKQYRYRNLWSMELRLKGDTSYFIDPCCRGPLPATGSQLEMYGNLPEIIWHGANGELVEPENTAFYAAECLVTCKVEKGFWQSVEVPDDLAQWLKLSNSCECDGRVCFPPSGDEPDPIGWLVALGDTPQETLDTMKEHIALLPPNTSCDITPLADLLKEIEQAEEQGIEFTDDKLPEPAEVIES